jgi:hypothetical protein
MTPTPHDALVRSILGQPGYAADELRALLPSEVVAELCLETLAPVDGAFIDAALDESNADLLFTVALRRSEGRRAYVLIEHQSTFDPRMARRLLRYQDRIWERHAADHPRDEADPPILVVLLHHGPRPWPGAPRFGEAFRLDEETRRAFGARLLEFEFSLDDLAAQSDEQLLARDCSAVVKLMLLALRNSRSHPRLHEFVAGAIALHRDELLRPEAEPALQRLVRYVLEVDPSPQTTIRTALEAASRPAARSSNMPTAAEVLQAEALQEALLVQLKVKFGDVDVATRARVESADKGQLLLWMQCLLNAPTLRWLFEGRP